MVSGFTQDELSLLVGKDRSLLSRWENGYIEFADEDVQRIADVLQVPVDQLVVVDEPIAAAVAR